MSSSAPPERVATGGENGAGAPVATEEEEIAPTPDAFPGIVKDSMKPCNCSAVVMP